MPLRVSSSETSADPASPASPSSGPSWDSLPDELLIQIFGHLAVVGSVFEEDDPLHLTRLPYRPSDLEVLPSTGLRGYPFLAQVCRRWRNLLETTMAKQLVWRHVCVDLGHELVTSIHTPLRWSNQRPSAAEYQAAFNSTSLSAGKVLRFLSSVAPHARTLAIANSEGFQGEDGESVSLVDKHDFGGVHLGFGLALMRENLTELVLHRCDALWTGGDGGGVGGGVWSVVGQLPQLRRLAVEGLRGVVPAGHVAALGELRKLESLSLISEDYRFDDWAVGLEGLPDAWSRLTALTKLELRGHRLLVDLPPWLPGLAALRLLDLSGCREMALGGLPQLTQLQVLVLQSLSLGHALPSPSEAAALTAASLAPAARALPDLLPLAPSLRSLSLAANCFTQLPEWLPRMSRLEHLDMAYNRSLQLLSPLNGLAALPHLAILDFRHVAADPPHVRYWGPDKCGTMAHLAQLCKTLRRRCPRCRVLMPETV